MSKTADIIKMMISNTDFQHKYIAAKAGITEVSLSRYLNGQREPNFKTFIKIATACNYDVIIRENEKAHKKLDSNEDNIIDIYLTILDRLITDLAKELGREKFKKLPFDEMYKLLKDRLKEVEDGSKRNAGEN